jgi:quinol monooxygenase YgiN
MHIQIVTFNLKGVSDADFRAGCEREAHLFANIPGCISKAWLADEVSNTYGGVYSFVDRAAMEAYSQSDLFKAVQGDPTLSNVTSRDFGVLDGPTRVTSPGLLTQAAE